MREHQPSHILDKILLPTKLRFTRKNDAFDFHLNMRFDYIRSSDFPSISIQFNFTLFCKLHFWKFQWKQSQEFKLPFQLRTNCKKSTYLTKMRRKKSKKSFLFSTSGRGNFSKLLEISGNSIWILSRNFFPSVMHHETWFIKKGARKI